MVYNKKWWETEKQIHSDYKSCNICMNDMKLVKSINGDYWLCKVCNNVISDF